MVSMSRLNMAYATELEIIVFSQSHIASFNLGSMVIMANGKISTIFRLLAAVYQLVSAEVFPVVISLNRQALYKYNLCSSSSVVGCWLPLTTVLFRKQLQTLYKQHLVLYSPF